MAGVNRGQIRDREQRVCAATVSASRQREACSWGGCKRDKKVSGNSRSRRDGQVDVEFGWVTLGLNNKGLGLGHLLRLGDCLDLRSATNPACLFLPRLDIPFGFPQGPGGNRDIVDHVLENGSTRVECAGRAQTNLGDICGNDRWLGQARGREGSREGMLYGEREPGANALGIGELGRADKSWLG